MKIILALFIAFTISFSIFYVTFSNFDSIQLTDDEILFYENVLKNEKKIFILGSSETQSINATHVQIDTSKYIDHHFVYNLAKASDSPDKRIYSLELISNSKPVLVLYGIGLLDVKKNPDGGFGTLIIQDSHSNIENLLPVPKEIINDVFLENIGFNNLRLNFLENPKFVILNQIRELTNENKISSLKQQIISDNIPFIKFDTEQLKLATTKVDGSTIKSCPQSIIFEKYAKDKKINSLVEIIEKLKINNIKVIIFTTPIHENCLDSIGNETMNEFEAIVNEIGENTNTDIYFLHDNYRNYDSWVDGSHLTFSNSFLYSNDVAEIIIQALK